MIFLSFLRWNLPKFSQHIATFGKRILNTKRLGFVKSAFSTFVNLCLLSLRKNWSDRFPSLPNFREFHRRKREKIHCQFWFLCSCWRHKISKNTDVFLWASEDYLSFRPQRACDRNHPNKEQNLSELFTLLRLGLSIDDIKKAENTRIT